MARTDEEKVAEIVEVDPSISLDVFIRQANRLVTVLLGEHEDLEDEDLELIETNLAAHFYACQRDMRASSENIGGNLSTTFQSKVGFGLSLTHYGQMAMMLDWTETLAAYNARITDPASGGVTPVMGGFHVGVWPDLDGDGLEG